MADLKIDPLGFALGVGPVCNLSELAAKLTASPVAQRYWLLDHARWNCYHLNLLKEHVALLNATCERNDILGNASFASDSTRVHRVRQQTYHLRPPPDDRVKKPKIPRGKSRLMVWRDLAAAAHPVTSGFRLNLNWESSEIVRKKSQPSQNGAVIVSAPKPLSQQQFVARVSWVRTVEAEDVQSVIDAIENAQKSRRPGAPRRLPPLELSGLAPHGQMSEARLDSIVAAAREDWQASLGALVVLAQVTACLSAKHLPNARFQRNGSALYLGTPAPALAQDVGVDAYLHHFAGEVFWRRIPADVGAVLEKALQDVPHEVLRAEHAVWLAAHRGSPAKLDYALRWNAPVWWDCSWLVAEYGLNVLTAHEGKVRAPGFRSYMLWHPVEMEERQLRLWARLEMPAEKDPDVGKIECCGTRHCLTIGHATGLFRVHKELIREASGALPEDYGNLVRLSNALAAATRLLEVLLTYKRSYPEPAPAILRIRERWRLADNSPLVWEKVRPRPVYFPPALEATLLEVARIFFRAVESLERWGYEITRPHNSGGWTRAYGFLPTTRPKTAVIRLAEPRKSLVVEGLLRHPSTELYGHAHPNSMRCLSYLILCRDSDFDRELLELHDHFPGGGSGSLDRHRSEPITQQEIRGAAAAKIMATIGLTT